MNKDDVFIIGSGFSKDVAQYPTLAELGGLDGPVLTKINGRLILNFISEKCLKTIPNNIEHLITYLHQEYPWRNEQQRHLAKAAYYDVVRCGVVSHHGGYVGRFIETHKSDYPTINMSDLFHNYVFHGDSVFCFSYASIEFIASDFERYLKYNCGSNRHRDDWGDLLGNSQFVEELAKDISILFTYHITGCVKLPSSFCADYSSYEKKYKFYPKSMSKYWDDLSKTCSKSDEMINDNPDLKRAWKCLTIVSSLTRCYRDYLSGVHRIFTSRWFFSDFVSASLSR